MAKALGDDLRGYDNALACARKDWGSVSMIWGNAYAPAFLSQIWATTLMQTTLIRDETTAALSLDLPEHARFPALRSATGGLRGKDHTRRTAELLEQLASEWKDDQTKRADSTEAEIGRALGALTEERSKA